LKVAHFNDSVIFEQNKICCRGLTFRFLLIKHNLLLMTNRGKNMNPSEVRFLCEYEMATYPNPCCDENPAIALNLLCTMLKRPYTLEALAAVTAKEIKYAYKLIGSGKLNHMNPVLVYSRMCGECARFEEKDEKFKKCGRCGSEFYCSVACQHNAWKDHKKICNEA
jgi:hypothetical protein